MPVIMRRWFAPVMLTKPQPYEAEAKGNEAEAKTHEAEAKFEARFFGLEAKFMKRQRFEKPENL